MLTNCYRRRRETCILSRVLRQLERFIETVTALPELYTEFDVDQWAGLVESMTVYEKDRIVWKLTCGMEIEG